MADIENVERGVSTKKVKKSVKYAIAHSKTKRIKIKRDVKKNWTVIVVRSP
ncbi:MAG: hypothetical protein OXE50_16245 [Chloroflexi bacterium]|nr:hypothetical protein [Chloroflexota bacterium]